LRRLRLTAIPHDELTVLKNLGLIDNKVNVAAILIFGRNPQSIVPWATIKVGKFIGDEHAPKMEKKIDENLMEQIEKSYIEVLSLIKR